MSVEIVMRIVRPFLISPTHPRQKPHAPQHLAGPPEFPANFPYDLACRSNFDEACRPRQCKPERISRYFPSSHRRALGMIALLH